MISNSEKERGAEKAAARLRRYLKHFSSQTLGELRQACRTLSLNDASSSGALSCGAGSMKISSERDSIY